MTETRVIRLEEAIKDMAMGPFGSNIKAENFVEDGVPVLRGQNLSDFYINHVPLVFLTEEKANSLARSIASAGDIVITHRGTLGQVSMIPRRPQYGRYVVSQSQMRVTLDEDVLIPEYFVYWIRSASGQRELMAFATQTGVPSLARPTASIKQLLVPIPPLPAQESIVSALGSLDDKIAANNNVVSQSIQLCTALVDRAITNEEVPLSEIASITMGSSPKGEFLNESGVGKPFFQGVRDFSTLFPGHRVFTDHPVREAVAGDILFAVRAPIGEVNIASEDCVIGRGVAAIKARENQLTLFYLLRSRPRIWDAFQDAGTVFASINKTDLSNALIPWAANMEENESIIRPIHEKAMAALKENQILAQTRDELLPLLMNGSISVGEASDAVGSVVEGGR